MIKSFEPLFGLGTLCTDACADEFKFRADETLPAAFGQRGDLLSKRTGLQIGGVIARMRVGFPLRDFDDPRGDGFEKIPVVRDHHHRARKATKKILQPACGLGVEVVGGFVEKQKIGLGRKSATERDTALFTTRQRANQRVQRRGMEGAREAFDAGLEVPSVRVLDEFQHVVKFFIRALARLIATQGFNEIGSASLDVCKDSSGGIELELLRQITDTQSTASGDFAGVGFVFPGEDFEEARLATSVPPHQRDFFSGRDGQRDSFQEKLVAVGETDFIGREKRYRHQRI